MKKVKKKVELHFQGIGYVHEDDHFSSILGRSIPIHNPGKTITFSTTDDFNPQELEAFIEVEVPETLKEFREYHNLSKTELVDWLNDNYTKE